jgi:hypothetical protein
MRARFMSVTMRVSRSQEVKKFGATLKARKVRSQLGRYCTRDCTPQSTYFQINLQIQTSVGINMT